MTLGEGSRSLADCQEAIKLIRTLSDTHFGQPATVDVIARAEAALGLALPPSLHHFVTVVGHCDVGHHEIFGLHGDLFEPDSGVNIVGATLLERAQGLPAWCIVFENPGDGTRLVLDAQRGYMVRRWETGGGDRLSEQERASFGAYLLMIALDQRDEESPVDDVDDV